MGHSLEKSLNLLIKIYTGNDTILAQQMENQLMKIILKDVRFTTLHNGTRYPFFNREKANYSVIFLKKRLYAIKKYAGITGTIFKGYKVNILCKILYY